MEKTILVVEDDKNIGKILKLQLEHAGYQVEVETDGLSADEKLREKAFDLVLLDIMLPQVNGLELCRRIKERFSVPVIMLTAKDSVSDKVIGLDFGADDYMTKPFEIEELLARIRARMRAREASDAAKEKIVIGNLQIDISSHRVERGGKTISLSKTEFDLLAYLAVNRGIVLKRSQILDSVWGYGFFGGDNVLDVYIKYVRDKIDMDFDNKLIEGLIRLARMDRDELQINAGPVGSGALIGKMIEDSQNMRKGRTIKTSKIENFKVIADKDLILECLRALFENAVNYTGENGTITFSAETKKGYGCISVEDDGMGISENDLGKIFERFSRTESSRKTNPSGSGLGLSLVKSIVEAQGGKIAVESRQGKGSVFTLQLPLEK